MNLLAARIAGPPRSRAPAPPQGRDFGRTRRAEPLRHYRQSVTAHSAADSKLPPSNDDVVYSNMPWDKALIRVLNG